MDPQLIESIGQLKATTKAAHQRLDKVENEIRQDISKVNDKLDELNRFMERGKGWSAAFLLMSGFAGAGLTKLMAMIFTK
jgi:Tfp pilus assembly protein PilN